VGPFGADGSGAAVIAVGTVARRAQAAVRVMRAPRSDGRLPGKVMPQSPATGGQRVCAKPHAGRKGEIRHAATTQEKYSRNKNGRKHRRRHGRGAAVSWRLRGLKAHPRRGRLPRASDRAGTPARFFAYAKPVASHWIRIFQDNRFAEAGRKFAGMGNGKGNPEEYYVAEIKPGKGVYEINGVAEELAAKAFTSTRQPPRLPLKCTLVRAPGWRAMEEEAPP